MHYWVCCCLLVTLGHEPRGLSLLTRYCSSKLLPVLASVLHLALPQVIGGMCWAIASCGSTASVNLAYDETLSLGKKM